MTELRTSLVLGGEDGRLKAVLRSSTGEVRDFTTNIETMSARVTAASAKTEAATASAAAAHARAAEAEAKASVLKASAEEQAAARIIAAEARTASASAAAAAARARADQASAQVAVASAKERELAAQRAALAETAAAQKSIAAQQALGKSAAGGGSLLGLNRGGLASLQASAVNAVQALSAGIDPLRVLQFEIPQALGALVQGGAVSMKTLIGLGGAIGVVVTALGGLYAAYASGDAQIQAFNRTLQLSGNAAGLTREHWDKLAESAQFSGKLTAGAARDISLGFASSQKISSEFIDRLIANVSDFAKATGQAKDDAADNLKEIFEDPLKGAKDLNSAFNILSASEREHIANLAATGNQLGAQNALLDALIPRIQDQAQNVGILTSVWNGALEAAGYYIDKVKQLGRGASPEDEISALKSRIPSEERNLQALKAQGLVGDDSDAERQINDMKARLQKLLGDQGVNVAQAELDMLANSLRLLGKDFDAADKAHDPFAAKQREIQEAIAKSTGAIDEYNKALTKAAMISRDPALKAMLERGLQDAQTAKGNSELDLSVLRDAPTAAIASLAIANKVAATGPRNRAATEAYETTYDQSFYSDDPRVHNKADLLASIAKQKVILQQTAAIRDQNEATKLNTALTIEAAQAWMRSGAEGAAADAARSAAIKALGSPIDATKEKLRQLAAAAADAFEKGGQQLLQLRQQADSQEAIADAALRGVGAEQQATLNARIGDATRSLQDSLANAADPAVAEGIRQEIAGITDELIRLDEAARRINIAHALTGQGDQIELLQKQLDLVNASNEARAVGLAHTQAEIDLRRSGVNALSDEGQQFLANADNIASMNEQLERQRAIAQELPNFFDQMFDRIGSGLTDLALKTGEWSAGIKNLGAAIESELVQEFVKLAGINPLKNLLLGSGLPTLSSIAGGGGAISQYTATAASSSGGGSGFAAAASPLAAMFGGSGGATSGLGTWLNSLFGGAPTNAAGFRATGAGPMASAAGGLPAWASFMNSGVGTGLAGAGVAGGLTAASGGSALQTALSSGGALIGTIAGSYFGPAGSLAGSALGGIAGNIIGGLFGGKDKKPPKQVSATTVDALGSGLFGVTDTVTKHSADVTSGLAGGAVDTLNALLTSLGGSVAGPLSGQLQYIGRTPRPMSTVGGVTNQFSDDEQGAKDAVADFVARTMIEAAKSDKLQGVSEAIKTAIANSGAADADALDAAIAFGKFYDRVDKIRTPADAAAQALADLAGEMTKASSQADQYGLDAGKLAGIFKANFTDDIADQMLQLTDPNAYALKQLDLEHAATVAQAEKLGADLTQVEQLYALKRQAIVEQGLAGVNDTFQDFFNSLKTGQLSALSPEEQLRQAKVDYDTAYKSGDATAFTQAASTLLTIAKDFYNSTQGYVDTYKQVLSDTKTLGNLSSDLPTFAAGGDHAGGWRLVGEEGPELEATGPARYFDAEKTASMLEALGQYGADGVRDNRLIHANDNEIQALYDMGGAGTRNPRTKLLQFKATGGQGTSASQGGGGGGSSRTGNSGATKAGPISAGAAQHAAGTVGSVASGGSAGKGTAGGSSGNTGVNLAGPNPGDMAGGGIVGPNGYLGMGGTAGFQGSEAAGKLSDASDKGWAEYGSKEWAKQQQTIEDAIAKGATPEQIQAAGDALAHRLNDYTDRYNSFGEDTGNFLASLLGFNEMKPTFDLSNLGLNADWSWDPAGAIGSLLGMAAGIPFGPGLVFDKLSELAGRPFAVPLGPSVFGDPDTALSASGAVNDNAVNSSLNSERLSALSAAAQSSSFGSSSAGGALQTPGKQSNSMTTALSQQNQHLVSQEKQFGALSRKADQQIALLTDIRGAVISQADWQVQVGARRKSA